MKKFFVRFYIWLGKKLEEEPLKIEQQQEILSLTQPETVVNFLPHVDSVKETENINKKITDKKPKKKPSTDVVEFDPRDIMALMEVPFVALSKNKNKTNRL